MLSAAQMPKSVEEAEELIRSTFGEMAHRSKVKEIAATLCLGFSLKTVRLELEIGGYSGVC